MAEWELSKENILPVKKGRALEHLGDGLRKPGLRKIEDNFEEIISAAGDDHERLLLAYSERYTWLRRRAGDNRAASQSLLERCTSSLLKFETLHNDLRYVKLWIEYAECASDSLDVFGFMYAQGVGSKLALFWIAWAFVLEKKSNFQKADQIYHTGMRCFAEPKQLLAQRYQQFQRRLSRRYLNNVGGGEEEAPIAADTSFVLGHQRNEIKAPAPFSVSMSMPVQSAKSSISIFEDITLDENMKPVVPKWGSLATEKDRTKENIGLTTNWINPVLPNLSSKTTSSAPSSTVSQSFIFMDPEFMDEGYAPHRPVIAPSIAAIARGALSTVTESKLAAVVTAEPVAAAQIVATSKVDDDQTINTKLALEDIEKMFNSDDFGFIAAVSDYERGNCQEEEEEDNFELSLDDFVSQRHRNFTLKHLLEIPRVSRDDNTNNYRNESSLPEPKRAKTTTHRQYEIVDHKRNEHFRAMCIEDSVLTELQNVPLTKVASKIHPLQIAKQLGNVRQSFTSDSVQVGKTSWTMTESFARGKFGVAVKVSSSSPSTGSNNNHARNNQNQIRIWKVDRNRSAAEWEAFIYNLMYDRKRQCLGPTASLIHFIIEPYELIQFQDATVLSLPYANCGTLINVLAVMQSNFDYQGQEIQAAYFALQMLKAVHVLHEMEVLHCDIKTDNWVLQISSGSCQLQLIDFGKARLAKAYHYEDFPALPYCNSDFAYLGTVGAQGYCCSLEQANKPWIYQPDYYGLTACLHQLLFLEELSVSHVTVEEAGRRGFGITGFDDLSVSEVRAKLIVPRQGPKRYWKGTMWQSLFTSLLNPPTVISRKVDLMRFASEIESFLSAQSSTKSTMDSFIGKLATQGRTRSRPTGVNKTKH